MSPLESKDGVRDRERSLREVTDRRLEVAEDHKEEFGKISEIWSEMGGPSLLETANGLDRISQELRSEAEEKAEGHFEEIRENVARERVEVSDRAEESALMESAEVQRLQVSEQRVGQFADRLAEATRERIDAEGFHRQIAESSREHQDQSADKGEELTSELLRLSKTMRSFCE